MRENSTNREEESKFEKKTLCFQKNVIRTSTSLISNLLGVYRSHQNWQDFLLQLKWFPHWTSWRKTSHTSLALQVQVHNTSSTCQVHKYKLRQVRQAMTFRTGAESLASPSMESVNPLRRVSLTSRRRWWLEWGWQFELIWCPALYDSTLLVLKSLAQIGKEKTIWFNCRQEPVAYVNGISVTPRCLNAFPYLIFVIFFTRAKFLENKIYT